MNNYIFIGTIIILAYIAGRYSAPAKIHVETVTVEKEVKVQDESKRTNQIERIIETTKPDGTKVKETRIKTKSESERATTERRDSTIAEKKDIENRRGVVVGPLVGLLSGTTGLLYGLHANKPFIGPIQFGGDLIVGPMFGIAGLLFVGIEL